MTTWHRIVKNLSQATWRRLVVAGAMCLLITCNALAGTKVSINEDNVLVVNGKKVFPVMLSTPPQPDGMAPSGRNALDELSDAGLNFLRSGPQGKDWSDEVCAREKLWLDGAAAHGMYCVPNLRNLATIPENPEKGAAIERQLRKLVALFKDHPGLAMYKGADEPEWDKRPVANVHRTYELLKDLDPDHPLWIVQAPRGTVETLKAYDPCYDVMGMDCYPIGYPPGRLSLLPNKEISMVGDYTKEAMEVTGGKKPVWMTLQICWSGVVHPGKTLRFPTFPEQRFMTYQAIINGARGLVYFGGFIPGGWTGEDTKLEWNWHFWNQVQRQIVEEIGEKSPLQPALVAAESKLPVKVDDKGIEFCVRETGTDVFVLACRRDHETALVKFSGLPAELSGGEVMFEEPRRVTAKDGVMSDWFAPFEVHVYRLRKG